MTSSKPLSLRCLLWLLVSSFGDFTSFVQGQRLRNDYSPQHVANDQHRFSFPKTIIANLQLQERYSMKNLYESVQHDLYQRDVEARYDCKNSSVCKPQKGGEVCDQYGKLYANDCEWANKRCYASRLGRTLKIRFPIRDKGKLTCPKVTGLLR